MDYSVSFFKVDYEEQEHGKRVVKDTKHLGNITIDDNGVGPNLTLEAKAFRHASQNLQSANKLVITRRG